jgi:tetratricopeptide (TPR) repeat protein
VDINSLSEEKNMRFVLERALIQWKNCAERVISRCPSDKLLILQTRHISSRMDDIARFVGAQKDTLIPELAHSNQTTRKHYALLRAPYRLLKEKFEQYCVPVMERYFPDITLDSFLDQSERERKNSCKASPLPRDSRYHFFPWLQKAEQFLATGDREKAVKCLDAALLMGPDNGALRRIHALKKKVNLAVFQAERMEEIVDLTDDLDHPDFWLRRAERSILKGDYLTARKCLVQFENIAPESDEKSLRHFAALYIRLRELLVSKDVMLNGLGA